MKTMNGEVWPLGTNDPTEFEKWPIEVQDFMKLSIILEEFREFISN